MGETGKPTKHSRRAALRTWLTGSASLTLLAAACALPIRSILAAPAEQTAGPAPAQVPAVAPSAPSSSAVPSASAAPGASTPGAATGSATQMCVLTREQTEGPYYIDVDLIRSDITEGKEGLPLTLDLTVLNATTCQLLPDATVEVWHCDAAGDYSGFSGSLPNMQGEPPGSDSGSPPPMRPGGPPPGGSGGPPPGGMMPGSGPAMRNTPTNDLVFLRGGQVSDAAGRVTFQTIYPGWYRGRTVHIHLKVHAGGQEVHTSQMFFDDATSDEVFGSQPYAAHAGRDTMNATDGIFQAGGQQGLLALTKTDRGYTGTLTLGVQA